MVIISLCKRYINMATLLASIQDVNEQYFEENINLDELVHQITLEERNVYAMADKYHAALGISKSITGQSTEGEVKVAYRSFCAVTGEALDTVSMEDIDSVHNPAALVMEGIGDWIKKFWEALKNAWMKFINMLKAGWKKLFGRREKQAKSIEQTVKATKKIESQAVKGLRDLDKAVDTLTKSQNDNLTALKELEKSMTGFFGVTGLDVDMSKDADEIITIKVQGSAGMYANAKSFTDYVYALDRIHDASKTLDRNITMYLEVAVATQESLISSGYDFSKATKAMTIKPEVIKFEKLSGTNMEYVERTVRLLSGNNGPNDVSTNGRTTNAIEMTSFTVKEESPQQSIVNISDILKNWDFSDVDELMKDCIRSDSELAKLRTNAQRMVDKSLTLSKRIAKDAESKLTDSSENVAMLKEIMEMGKRVPMSDALKNELLLVRHFKYLNDFTKKTYDAALKLLDSEALLSELDREMRKLGMI